MVYVRPLLVRAMVPGNAIIEDVEALERDIDIL